MQLKLPAFFYSFMKSKATLCFLFFFSFSTSVFAHVFEIRAKIESNGTLTFYLQSFHTKNEINCVGATSGLLVNGVPYTFGESDIFSGDARPFGPITVAQDIECLGVDRSNQYLSYAVIANVPYTQTIVVEPFSSAHCFSFCIGGPLTFEFPVLERGKTGCSHGYWKNAKWWTGTFGVGAANYKRGDNFFATFNGIVNTRGLSPAMTLDGGLNLGGGSYKNVARQGIAALLNAADPEVKFPYSESEIKKAVYDVFQTGSAQLPDPSTNYTTLKTYNASTLGAVLDRMNNLGCPINAHGEVSGSVTRGPSALDKLNENTIQKVFQLSGYPNPSRDGFNVIVNGSATEKASLRVTDATGRVIEQLSSVPVNHIFRVGANYPAGMYYIEVMQDGKKQQLKLVKTAN